MMLSLPDPTAMSFEDFHDAVGCEITTKFMGWDDFAHFIVHFHEACHNSFDRVIEEYA